jgi:ParB/RepB/Spo0J family partition protein
MSEIIMIPLTDIELDEDFNCRETISGAEVNSLAKSIMEHSREKGFEHEDGTVQQEFFSGLIQPVTVRRIADSGVPWQLVAGYRRRAAFTRLQSEDSRYGRIPAIVVRCTELEAFRMNLTENIQRKNLNLKEEAGAVGRLRKLGLTQNDIAQELGMSRGWTQVRLYMFDLPDDVQDEVVANNLTTTMVRELWQIASGDDQRKAIHDIKLRLSKGIKVREVKTRVRPKDRKLIPKKPEILEKMEYVAGLFGWGVTTRAMSWCLGEITDGDFEMSLEASAAKRLSDYKMLYELRRSIAEGEVVVNGMNIEEIPVFADMCEKAGDEYAERQRKEDELRAIQARKDELGQAME